MSNAAKVWMIRIITLTALGVTATLLTGCAGFKQHMTAMPRVGTGIYQVHNVYPVNCGRIHR